MHIIVTSLARSKILSWEGLRTQVYLNVVPTIPSHGSLFSLALALWIAALHLCCTTHFKLVGGSPGVVDFVGTHAACVQACPTLIQYDLT